MHLFAHFCVELRLLFQSSTIRVNPLKQAHTPWATPITCLFAFSLRQARFVKGLYKSLYTARFLKLAFLAREHTCYIISVSLDIKQKITV